jgi:hypothetical protein
LEVEVEGPAEVEAAVGSLVAARAAALYEKAMVG